MMILFHGSPSLFNRFDLSNVGEGSGVKFGFGVYLTQVEKTAVHYSQPRKQPLTPDHYLYTVEIDDLVEGNHIVSASPVPPCIIKRTEMKLGKIVPEEKKAKGKEFRKWLGMELTGLTKPCLESEKAAAQFLDGMGVRFMVWPTAQTKPDGDKNVAVFNADNVRILKRESIGIQNVRGKWILVDRIEVPQ